MLVGDILTETAGPGTPIVTVADADWVGSARLVAITFAVCCALAVEGAV